MGRLEGRVAVITGSTRGFGLASATAFVREGARVVVSSRSPEAVDEVVSTLGPDLVEGVVADVARRPGHEALLAAALERFGRLDVWVNNAGVSGTYGPTPALADEDFLRVLDTNVRGAYLGSIVATRYFLSHEGGMLVNILGRGDRGPVPNQNAYASSKAWLRSFTLALAEETRGRGVQVLAFNPGLMLTDLVQQVHAVKGYERRLRPFATVLRLWGEDPAVPAARLVDLASGAERVRSGRAVNMLTPARMLAGVWREFRRRLLREPAPAIELHVTTAEPVVPMDPTPR
ncbi:MAG TPA: SDR family NAD(P)-dependent oxidoreductase [Trueperaceae bacterium]|nr:SDR family NAD(P)-dependent oxidoreductase [Trueperaceae bacterium]